MMRCLSDRFQEVAGKTVLVRCGFDVPIENGEVKDTTRIEDCLETLRLLLEYGCKLVLLGHYDRPGGKVEESKSLFPVVKVLEELLGETVGFVRSLDDGEVRERVTRLVLLENLRFWKGEELNDEKFVKQLAKLGDYYVNEAFSTSHRKHASIVGLAKKLPSVAGLHLEREVQVLSKIRNHPEKPLVLMIGGAKVETKGPILEKFEGRADWILVGGKVVVDLRKDLIGLKKVILAKVDDSGQDITEDSARKFAEKILEAKTVVWNGTMGVFEKSKHQLGTRIVAEAMSETKAFTVVGGGDTESALTELDLEDGIDHISTGGGAMLKFLVNGTLVGIDVLGYEK